MVSKAREDLPEPERPVKTTSWSRGISTERFFRLCTRAPCTRIVDVIAAPYRSHRDRLVLEGHRHALSLQGVQDVAQRRSLLKTQLVRGPQHRLLDPGDLQVEVIGQAPFE